MALRTMQLAQLEPRQLMAAEVVHSQLKLTTAGPHDLTGKMFPALEDVARQYREGQPVLDSYWDLIGHHGAGEASNGELYPVTAQVTGNVTIKGGSVHGIIEPQMPWNIWKLVGDGVGFRTEGPGLATLVGPRVDNVEDGYDPRGSGQFRVEGAHFTRIHDDAVENDAIMSGEIIDSLFETYTFLSEQPGRSPNPYGSRSVVRINQALIEFILLPHPDAKSADRLDVGVLFKWRPGAGRVEMNDSDILLPRAHHSISAMAFAPGTYHNVRVYWTGTGPFPVKTPPGVTVLTNPAPFYAKKAAWLASHSEGGGAPNEAPTAVSANPNPASVAETKEFVLIDVAKRRDVWFFK